MRYFSAQYIFTGTGSLLKRGIICTSDDGTIISLEETGGNLSEKHSVEFYNGIITPGFVNCHCHLELSCLKDELEEKSGLGRFLMAVNSIRKDKETEAEAFARQADLEMFREGIVLCADICNTPLTFALKRESRIRYISLLEVFGIDSEKAGKRFSEVQDLADKAAESKLRWAIVPHALYSVSMPLLRLIMEATKMNSITSMHFLESQDEITFLKEKTGPIMDSYRRFLPAQAEIDTAREHVSAVLEQLSRAGNLILVHNTFIDREQIQRLRERKDLYYCLCPNSNLFIENRVPPASLLHEEGCRIVLGTDSLSSNHKLSILQELKTLANSFPGINLDVMLGWATINGAKALGEDSLLGSIEPGKKPGLLLLKDADLLNMRLRNESSVQRLI